MTQQILSHVYDNGLVLVAEPIMSLESAAFTFLTPLGCVLDPPERSGLAAFTCEMMLRGAGTLDSRQFIEALENLGVERGESVSSSHISFGGATLSGNLEPALALFADLLRRPHLPPEQIEAARLVVLQELRAIEDEPAQKVMLELRRRHYSDPWGRPSQGDLASLEAITIDEVRRHCSGCVGPNGTIVGVAGRIDWPRLKDTIGRLLGDWQPIVRPPLEPQRQLERRAHLHHESSQTQIGVAYASVPYRHPDYFAAWGAVGVLSGGMSSRLFTEVREKRGLCYTVYASYNTLRDRGSVLCYAGTTAPRAQETLDVTLGELTRLAAGVEENELGRLKARIKSGLIMQHESSSSRSSAIARDWYHLGRARTLDEVGGMVDALSCESINAYLSQHPPGDYTIVTLGSQPLEVPVAIS